MTTLIFNFNLVVELSFTKKEFIDMFNIRSIYYSTSYMEIIDE